MLNHSLIFEPNKVEVILEIIIKRDSKAWFIEIQHGKFQNKKNSQIEKIKLDHVSHAYSWFACKYRCIREF